MEDFTLMHSHESKKYPTICIAEDRKSCEPALKLLLLSLCRSSPALTIIVFYPPADPAFFAWVKMLNADGLSIRTTPFPDAGGWNVKPQALLGLLGEGYLEVVWIDSDILVNKDMSSAFGDLDSSVLVATEEALGFQNEKDGVRARRWGLPVKRNFEFPLNTAVVRVTQHHVPLLRKWKLLLDSPEYKEAQKQHVLERPIHMVGDQDVLTALLTSEEFHGVPVKVLRRGRDIIQFSWILGFTLAERLVWMLRGIPMFIHAQGTFKPWLMNDRSNIVGARLNVYFAYLDLSPYVLVAEKLAPEIAREWAIPHSKLNSILRILGFGYPPLVGMPLAALIELERNCRGLIKSLFDRFYPEAVFAIRARRQRRGFREMFWKRQSKVKRRIFDKEDAFVLNGPFKGMKYLNEVVWGPIEPKWLGTYEKELHPLFERILKREYSTIIDVGSAEGYYAVGLAMKFPSANVFSYDTDPWAREQQRRLANINSVTNITIGKYCTPKHLAYNIKQPTLVICDIEGFEYDLLDPQVTPELHVCDILVELHEHRDYGFTSQSGANELIRRFSQSHSATIIDVEPRTFLTPEYNDLRQKLDEREFIEIVDERRVQVQVWLWLEVRK